MKKILHSSFFILHLIALSLHNKMLQWYYDSLKGKQVKILCSPAAVIRLYKNVTYSHCVDGKALHLDGKPEDLPCCMFLVYPWDGNRI